MIKSLRCYVLFWADHLTLCLKYGAESSLVDPDTVVVQIHPSKIEIREWEEDFFLPPVLNGLQKSVMEVVKKYEEVLAERRAAELAAAEAKALEKI